MNLEIYKLRRDLQKREYLVYSSSCRTQLRRDLPPSMGKKVVAQNKESKFSKGETG